jgi:hypothetical protein
VKARDAVLLALAAAATLTTVASAGPQASRQRVAITTQAARSTPVSPFVFIPLQSGTLKRDSGMATATFPPERIVIRDGQSVSIYDGGRVTLKGKRGRLVMSYHDEWVDSANGYHVATGTWKVIRGTGQYAHITGGGRSGSVALDRGPWSSRLEGFLTTQGRAR